MPAFRQPADPGGQALGVLVADGEHGQHRVGDQAAQREQQRVQRRVVGPLGVVDDQQHGPVVLQPAEQLEHAEPGADRVVAPGADQLRACGARGARELVEHAVRELRLGGVAARADDLEARRRGDQRPDQRGLADPGAALQHDHPRPPGACLVALVQEHRKIGVPPSKRRLVGCSTGCRRAHVVSPARRKDRHAAKT